MLRIEAYFGKVAARLTLVVGRLTGQTIISNKSVECETRAMKLSITLIGWEEYPKDRKIPDSFVYDLSDHTSLTNLIVMFGNGIIGEMRAEGDTADTLKILRGVIHGPGACKAHVLTDQERDKLWLYQSGDECYTQEGEPPGYVFLNPRPQSHLFVSVSR